MDNDLLFTGVYDGGCLFVRDHGCPNCDAKFVSASRREEYMRVGRLIRGEQYLLRAETYNGKLIYVIVGPAKVG